MIEIHEPEIEALIHDRLTAGSFQTIEQVLLQALRDAPMPVEATSEELSTGTEIVAAFQRCPVQSFNFEFEPTYSPVSNPVQF